jgi:hypothetical protein
MTCVKRSAKNLPPFDAHQKPNRLGYRKRAFQCVTGHPFPSGVLGVYPVNANDFQHVTE